MAKKKIILTTDADFKKYGLEREMDASFFCGDDSKVSKKSAYQGVKRKKGGVSEKNGKRIIKGYASTTHKDRVKDVITIEALKKSKDDLLKQGSNTVFFNHDTDIPIGRVLKTSVDKVGLFVEVLISKAKDTNSYWTKLKEGILNAFSIRLAIKKMEIIKDEASGKIEEFRILSMELFEVSVVGMPCNPGATITDAIGKSFTKSKRDGVPTMSTKQKSKKSGRAKNITSVVQEVVGDDIQELKSAVATLTNHVVHNGMSAEEIEIEKAKSLLKEKGLLKDTEDSAELTPEQQKIKDLEKAIAEAEGKSKNLTPEQQKIKDLEDRLKSLENGTDKRKGHNTDDDEDEDDDDGTPKKVLKNAADVDTIKYVDFLFHDDNEHILAGLTEPEQAKAKSIYMEVKFASMTESE